MFERFTDTARRTVVLAQEESRLLGHDHIGTEHLLLGLLRDGGGGPAATALTSLGISLAAARQRVEGAGGRGQSTAGHIPFTAQAKRTLELALREALNLGHDYIGTGHILLGLVRDRDCQGAQILAELGAEERAVRQSVIKLLPVEAGDLPRPSVPGGRRSRLGTWDEGTARIESLRMRLDAVERWAGLTPDLAGRDREVARVRREKEAAIDAQDFKLAEVLSDKETGLLVDRDRLAREWTAGPSVASQLAQLHAEVARVRAVLRDHGLDPDSQDEAG